MGIGIAWTDDRWNYLSGCDRVSPGCLHCYAKRENARMCRLFPERYRNGFKLTVHSEELDKPCHWRKPRRVFVNTVSDTFHPDVPDEINRRAFGVMCDCGQHDFQVLTKRPERMLEFAKTIDWPQNVWAGTTIENNDYVYRADILREVHAPVRFISYEPALGPLPDLDLTGIDLVIMGGESGPNFRPMDPDWAREMRDRCVSEGVAFFFKQWSGVRPKALGRELDGVVWDEMPRINDGGEAA